MAAAVASRYPQRVSTLPEVARIRKLLKSVSRAGFDVTHGPRATKKSLTTAARDLGFELPEDLAAYFKAFGGIYVGGAKAPRNFYSLEDAVLRTREYRSVFDEARGVTKGLPVEFVVVFDRGSHSNRAAGVVYDARSNRLWETDGARYGVEDAGSSMDIWSLVENELNELIDHEEASADGAGAGYEPDMGAVVEELDRTEAKNRKAAEKLTATSTGKRVRSIRRWPDGFTCHESLDEKERLSVAEFLARIGGESEGGCKILGRGATMAQRFALHSELEHWVELDDLLRALPSEDAKERQARLDALLAKPSDPSWNELGMLLVTWPEGTRADAIAHAGEALEAWPGEARTPHGLLMRRPDTATLARGPDPLRERTFDGSFSLADALAVPACRSLTIRRVALGTTELEGLAASSLPLEHLHFGETRLSPETAPALAALGIAKPITRLSLEHNDLGPKGTSAIFRDPSTWRHLRDLDLSSNEIGNAGLTALSAASLPELRRLRIAHNPETKKGLVDDAGAVKLAASEGLGRLEILDLSCQALTAAGVAALVTSPHLSSLRDLTLTADVKLAALVDACKGAAPRLTKLAIGRAYGKAPLPKWEHARFLRKVETLAMTASADEVRALLASGQLESLERWRLDFDLEEKPAKCWAALVESPPPRSLRRLNLEAFEPTSKQAEALIRSPWGAQLEAIEVSHYIDPKTWTALYDAGLVSSDAMMFLD